MYRAMCVLLGLILLSAPALADVCQHRVDLWDCYGDGWNGNTLDVLVNGVTVLSQITIADYSAGPLPFYFDAATGDTIQTIYYPLGEYTEEPYYFIYDGGGTLIGQDGTSGGDCYVMPTGITVTGNCAPPEPGACCHPNGTCDLTVQAECLAPSVWLGPSSVCDPNPCTPSYCAAGGGCDEYIARVQVDVIDNSTSCSMYADYTALGPVTLTPGVATTLTVTNGHPYSSDTCTVWIDWNHDYAFDDGSSENLGDVLGYGPYNISITPPLDALPGPTRMRIRIDYANPNPVPCGPTTYGEVEDYTVSVIEVSGACCTSTGCVPDVSPADCAVLAGAFLGELPCPTADCDSNGVPDACELALGSQQDCNDNSIPDNCDISGGTSQDCQPDGVPDECQASAGLALQLDDGTSENKWGLTSGGELCWINHFTATGAVGAIGVTFGSPAYPGSSGVMPGQEFHVYVWGDANGDGVPSGADFLTSAAGHVDAGSIDTDQVQAVPLSAPLAVSGSFFIGASVVSPAGGYPATADTDGWTGAPDQAFLTYNSVPFDPTNLGYLFPMSALYVPQTVFILRTLDGGDCNGNGVPDDCDIASGFSQDCNANAVPDECDIANGTSPDADGNGIPDECDIGACCLPSGSCVPAVSLATCLGLGGIYQGNGSSCDPNPCTVFYCAAGAGYCDEYISGVQIGAIDNPSGCEAGQYADYTALSTVLGIGLATPLTVTNGNPIWSSDVCSVWVDWNQDYLFDDSPPELVGDVPGVGPYDFAVTPPGAALLGATRLRVRIDYNNLNPNPCGVTDYGEVEDYTVVVVPTGACCHPIGTCDITAEADCLSPSLWLGPDTICDECPPPTGACCHPDTTCEITTEANCPWWGLWLGPATTCDECLPPSATVALQSEPGCYHHGDTITVEVDMSGATVKVTGGQFFLAYDSDALQFVSMDPGDPPLTLEVYECSPTVFPVPPQCTPTLGLIDYAVGVPPGGTGTAADTTLARITFLATADVCNVADVVAFRTHDPPTTLTDTLGSAVPLTLADLPPLLIDSTPPVLSDCPTDNPTVECYADVPDPAPVTALDNCDGVIAAQLDEEESNPGSNCDNVITRTWTATDSCGNSTSCTQTITVDDITAPVLSGCPTDNPTVQCYADVPAPAIVTALDNCDGAIPVQFDEEESNPGSNCNNVITRTWTATDSCGSSSSCTQTITMNDTTPPVVTCPPDITVKAEAGCEGAQVTWSPATAQDNCDGALPATCNPPSGSFFPLGPTTVTCSATDICGNTDECSFTVTVAAVNELVVTIDLDGTIATPVARCITFVLWTCDPLSSVVAEEELTFQAVGGATRATATLDVPCGDYTCITARDRLHTLRRTLDSLAIVGTQYVADFTAANQPLLGGNLNDSRWIDILDFGVFMFQWNTGYDSDGDGSFDGNTTCSTAYPHADVNGDGLVTTADFTFIQTNFLLGYEANCCGQEGLRDDESGPVTRISVADLIAQGLGELAAGDVNGDGWLDELDMDAFAAGLPPPIHVGDLNCDGAVDFGDINPFVLALSNPAAWEQTYSGCNLLNADVNSDGNVDLSDINPFIALLQQ